MFAEIKEKERANVLKIAKRIKSDNGFDFDTVCVERKALWRDSFFIRLTNKDDVRHIIGDFESFEI